LRYLKYGGGGEINGRELERQRNGQMKGKGNKLVKRVWSRLRYEWNKGKQQMEFD
jgi:hypothetical protein